MYLVNSSRDVIFLGSGRPRTQGIKVKLLEFAASNQLTSHGNKVTQIQVLLGEDLKATCTIIAAFLSIVSYISTRWIRHFYIQQFYFGLQEHIQQSQRPYSIGLCVSPDSGKKLNVKKSTFLNTSLATSACQRYLKYALSSLALHLPSLKNPPSPISVYPFGK